MMYLDVSYTGLSTYLINITICIIDVSHAYHIESDTAEIFTWYKLDTNDILTIYTSGYVIFTSILPTWYEYDTFTIHMWYTVCCVSLELYSPSHLRFRSWDLHIWERRLLCMFCQRISRAGSALFIESNACNTVIAERLRWRTPERGGLSPASCPYFHHFFTLAKIGVGFSGA